MAIIQGNHFDLLHNNGMLSVLVRIASMRLDEAILMSTHNIQFQDKPKKISLNICFL